MKPRFFDLLDGLFKPRGDLQLKVRAKKRCRQEEVMFRPFAVGEKHRLWVRAYGYDLAELHEGLKVFEKVGIELCHKGSPVKVSGMPIASRPAHCSRETLAQQPEARP